MRIAYITAGAAGMYCGSCMKDNTLAAALNALGHDTQLIPTYTPIRVDEDDVSTPRVFFGGINIFLEQKSWLFRHTPWLFDRLFNFPRLLRWISPFAVRTQASTLGGLTISMLQGAHGKQRKEIAKLLRHLQNEVRPDAVVLTNLLISGFVEQVRAALKAPIWGTLQGDDIYLDALHEADRNQCIELIRTNASLMAGQIVTSHAYADFMAEYLGLPRETLHVAYPGINLKGHGGLREFRDAPPYTIGYFARICKEKGFNRLIDAFIAYQHLPDAPPARLRASGWLGGNNQTFFHEQLARLDDAGLSQQFEYVPSPNHAGKIAFLQSLDLLSVPTEYHEPKGLYVLEALANGVPVVQPRHGSFPELLEATGGGLLVEPNDPVALAEAWKRMLRDTAFRQECGRKGQAVVNDRFTAERMARATVDILSKRQPGT